jgi:hypothetical protein
VTNALSQANIPPEELRRLYEAGAGRSGREKAAVVRCQLSLRKAMLLPSCATFASLVSGPAFARARKSNIVLIVRLGREFALA